MAASRANLLHLLDRALRTAGGRARGLPRQQVRRRCGTRAQAVGDRLDEAEALGRDAIERVIRAHGRHPYTAAANRSHAETLIRLGRGDEAPAPEPGRAAKAAEWQQKSSASR